MSSIDFLVILHGNTFQIKNADASTLRELLPFLRRWLDAIDHAAASPDQLRINALAMRLRAQNDSLQLAVSGHQPTPTTLNQGR